MTKKQKRMLSRILFAGAFLILLFILEKTDCFGLPLPPVWKTVALYILAIAIYLYIGYDVLGTAFSHILNGQVFDENFLMVIATFGAFFVGEFTEAVGVMLFFQIGQLCESIAVGKSRASIKELMEIAPDEAVIEENGALRTVDPEEVKPGDILVIRPGDKVPVDGTVIRGSSAMNTASLTGESVPMTAGEGDKVISGCINMTGELRVRADKAFEDSTVAKVLELVENASSKKAPVEKFITRFAGVYTPIVTVAAVLLAVIPPLFFHGQWYDWIRRACTFLIISCPCALVVSVPLTFFGGIGAASRRGVLVKGSNFLELLSDGKTMVFDKTGTLTTGRLSVSKVIPKDHQPIDWAPKRQGNTEILKVCRATLPVLTAAYKAELFSTHPLAEAVRDAFSATGETVDSGALSGMEERSGEGVSVYENGRLILAGNQKLMERFGIKVTGEVPDGTVIFTAEDGEFLGTVVITDTVKVGAKEAVRKIKEAGVKKTVMLTGDRQAVAMRVAADVGMDEMHAELLPQEKVALLEQLLAAQNGRNHEKTVFVGDGINDAPALMRADVGIAMGSLGADAAIEAADIVLMDDDIGKIAETVGIARKTLRIVKQNIILALGVKFTVLILGALGAASMGLAVFADVGVLVLAVLNAMRMMLKKR